MLRHRDTEKPRQTHALAGAYTLLQNPIERVHPRGTFAQRSGA